MQEGQYAQAVDMFTEAISCDPKDNRYIICGHGSLQRKYIHFRHMHYIPFAFSNVRTLGSLGIDPIAITAWSSTLRPWQMQNAPFSWPQTGPKDTFARVVLLWA